MKLHPIWKHSFVKCSIQIFDWLPFGIWCILITVLEFSINFWHETVHWISYNEDSLIKLSNVLTENKMFSLMIYNPIGKSLITYSWWRWDFTAIADPLKMPPPWKKEAPSNSECSIYSDATTYPVAFWIKYLIQVFPDPG